MTLQFEDIFASEGVRTGEKQRDTLVEDLAGLIVKAAIVRMASLQGVLEQGVCHHAGLGAGDAQDTDTTAPGGGGDGGDSVGIGVHDKGLSLFIGILYLTGNQPLLQNTQGVVGDPVKYQTGREPQKHKRKHDRH